VGGFAEEEKSEVLAEDPTDIITPVLYVTVAEESLFLLQTNHKWYQRYHQV
jgi:hypothetical protein